MRAKRMLLGFGVIGAGLLFAASAAWACTNLATLNLSQAAGSSGQNVTVTGSSFKVASTGPAIPVVLHWNGATGPILATVAPDATGNISASVTIPDAQPGYYVLVATQQVNGTDAYGTPARAAFQILAPGQRAAVTPNAVQGGTVAPATSSTGVIALTITLGVLGLALFGAGVGAFARQARRREVAAAEPVKRS
ncbi:MAG TPA: hypothetical protein VHT75_15630 [Acidimicrobiales bacterium]|nr:hypothetical protein [Acidimicrobiales bacterium]